LTKNQTLDGGSIGDAQAGSAALKVAGLAGHINVDGNAVQRVLI